MTPTPLVRSSQIGIVLEQCFVVGDARREELQELAHGRNEILRQIAPEAAGPEIADHHPLPGHHLEQVENVFALAEAVEEDRHRGDVEGVGAQPDQMAGDAGQFGQDDANDLRPRRRLDAQQLLDRQDVAQIVGHRRQVVHPVGHDQRLGVGLGLHVLFDAGVQEADIRGQIDDGFAVQLHQQAQHAVGAGMLRPHAEQHVLFGVQNLHPGAELGPQLFDG